MWVRASTLPYARKSHLLQHEHRDSYASAHLIRCSLGSVTRVKGKGADRGGRSTMKRARTTSWTRNTMRAWVLATRPTRRISSQFFPSFPLRSILLSPRILFPVCLWSCGVSYTFPFVSRVVSFRLVFSLRLCRADVVDRVRGCRQALARGICLFLLLSSFLFLPFSLLSSVRLLFHRIPYVSPFFPNTVSVQRAFSLHFRRIGIADRVSGCCRAVAQGF